jgi:hypothetical protein
MAPDKPDKPRRATRDEFEVAYYTKELGRPLQRKLLQRRLNELTDHTISAASHGDDPKMEIDTPLPREDRAG